MSRPYIPPSLRRIVADQAGQRCGYCQTAQAYSGGQLHIDHVIPFAAGGQTIESNLWLACGLCNRYKGTKTHALDPVTNEIVPLFNPRLQVWWEHFAWSEDGLYVIGQTPSGRATVIALKLNNDHLVPARKNWVRAGWHPPKK
jgi:hypothetical protein